MGGITTDVCLIFPALSAVAEGFEVQAVLDVSGSPYEISEMTARKRMELAGVQFTATNTIIAELAQDWSTRREVRLCNCYSGRIATNILADVDQLRWTKMNDHRIG